MQRARSIAVVNDELRFIDKNLKKRVDALEMLLLYCAKHTLLPELYSVFGSDSLLRFLDLFAGTTIKVPDRDVMERAVRDIDIYIQVKELSDKGAAKKALAKKYSIGGDRVESIYNFVRSVMMASGVEKKNE